MDFIAVSGHVRVTDFGLIFYWIFHLYYFGTIKLCIHAHAKRHMIENERGGGEERERKKNMQPRSLAWC